MSHVPRVRIYSGLSIYNTESSTVAGSSASAGSGSGSGSKIDATIKELVSFMQTFGMQTNHSQCDFEEAGLRIERLLGALTPEENRQILPAMQARFANDSPEAQHLMIFRLLAQSQICEMRHP